MAPMPGSGWRLSLETEVYECQPPCTTTTGTCSLTVGECVAGARPDPQLSVPGWPAGSARCLAVVSTRLSPIHETMGCQCSRRRHYAAAAPR